MKIRISEFAGASRVHAAQVLDARLFQGLEDWNLSIREGQARVAVQGKLVTLASAQVRSRIMRSIKSKDTSPELRVRSSLHRMGFRFRIHDASLPGRPDIKLSRHKAIIFVNGCFWHQHKCKLGKKPNSNLDYWVPKLLRNVARDKANYTVLRRAGWRVLTVWECEVMMNRHQKKLARFLAADI